MDKFDLKKRMLELDNFVNDLYPGLNFECVIVGGGALLIKNTIARSTLDIDVLYVSKEVADLFTAFDFNSRVKALSHCFSYNYQERLELVDINTLCIKYYTPCIEDLIISKLYAYRKKDVEDLLKIREAKEYDSKLLAEIVAEAKQSALNERSYMEMVGLYKTFFGGDILENKNI